VQPVGKLYKRRLDFRLTWSALSTELAKIQRGKKGAHGCRRRFLGLAFHNGLWAGGALARRASRTYGRRRAFDLGTTRTRAGGALTTVLAAGGIVHNDRLGVRDRALEHVLGEIGCGRALGLKHVGRHIRACGRRRYGALEDVFAHVGIRGA